MYKDDIIGIFGATLSSVFATLGFLWNIGVLQLIFSFLAGSFTTYVVQRRLQMESERRKISRENAIVMRDTIYGPIFEEITNILEKIKNVEPFDWTLPEALKEVMANYLFSTIKPDHRSKLSEILYRVEKYLDFRRATELLLQRIIRREIQKTYGRDIGSNENEPHLSLLVGVVNVAPINLIRMLLLGMEPRDYVITETEKWGENATLEVSMGIEKNNVSEIELIYKAVLNEVEKESLWRDEGEQKARLISELEAFLEQIKVFVNLE